MSKHRNWCFTCFNEVHLDDPVEWLRKVGDHKAVQYIVCQKEICATTEKVHLQGYVEFTVHKRLNEVKKVLLDHTVHLEPRQGSQAQAIAYCQKLESRQDGPWEIGTPKTQGKRSDWERVRDDFLNGMSLEDSVLKYPDLFGRYSGGFRAMHSVIQQKLAIDGIDVENVELRTWQKELDKYVSENKQGPRKIRWYVDLKGNTGKSWWSRYAIKKHKAFYTTNAKTADISFAYSMQPVVVFDLARTTEDRVNYGVMEMLKNGLLFSAKYASTLKIFKQPTVIVMSNFHPNREALSRDRWDIVNLSPMLGGIDMGGGCDEIDIVMSDSN